MAEFLIISLLLAFAVCGIAFNARSREPAVIVPSTDVTRRVLRRQDPRLRRMGAPRR